MEGALVGVAAGGIIIVGLSLIAAIVIIVLSIVILCRCHRQNDRVRTGVTYLKVTCGFILLYQLFVVISAGLSATMKRERIPGTSLWMNMPSAHLSAISIVFSTASYALFIATQFEFARGLKMIASMAGHGEGANMVEVRARKSRMFSVIALAFVMILAIASFGLYEAFLAGTKDVEQAQTILVFIIEAVLAISSIVCLVFTVRVPRIGPHQSIGKHMIVIATLTALRHIVSAAVSAFLAFGVQSLLDDDRVGTTVGLTAASAIAILAGSWTFCITLGMAYGICRREYGGLRSNSSQTSGTYAPIKDPHDVHAIHA